MKIVTIIGARPQFIKAATVSRVFRNTPNATEVLVHTGQHYDSNMSDVFFEELDIPKPAYHLGIGSSNHGTQTGRMLEAIEGVLLDEKPDWVLVYGDTNSTLAGALAAAKLHIPVAHVEAGLRSFNRKMPEEINRILTDHASDLLFAPTEIAVKNLHNEGLSSKTHLVGDVMYDGALFFAAKAEKESRILEALKLTSKSYILATIHRAENTDDPQRLNAIFEGLSVVAKTFPIILPLHPRTKVALKREGIQVNSKGLHLIEPVGYLDMVMLEKNAKLIATDSGRVQKEAYFYRVPCVTLRDETEWLELVESGWNSLIPPTSKEDIAKAVLNNLSSSGNHVNLYGGGHAGQMIVNLLS
jgi:UDP-GlcNAc3NAcA epimerase